MEPGTKENTSFDADKIREHFPVFFQPENEGLIYLDSAATSQRPREVLTACKNFYEKINANTHRGAYKIAERATAAFEAAREKTAKFVGAGRTEEIIFVRNTTEAINFVAYGWARKFIGTEDEILVTEMEHHSNLIPWQITAQKTGARLRFFKMNENGILPLDQLDSLLSRKTKLVAVTHVSNVLGTVNPVKEIIRAAHNVGAKVVVDGAQSVPHLPVNVVDLDADFFAFSGHKMLAPMGIGVLYGKTALLEEMEPIYYGGEMIKDVDYYQSTWNDLPWKFEAGTQNIGGAVGLSAAIDFINSIGIDNIRKHDHLLTEYALNELKKIKDLVILGSTKNRGPAISFTLGNIHAHDLATFLDQKNIAVRSGHHCAKLVMKKFNVAATARASFYLYNTKSEIDALVHALNEAKGYFSKWR
ncbi:MAG: SufS family cysteine desulfurase [Actinobacteria bacterium]|nr:SufS family cysteine desulfurase [Actinomycetota bacterium]